MADAHPLPANLRRYGAAKRLSQKALAEKAGLSRIGYRDIETGKAVPRLDSLQRISEALGVVVPDLLVPVRDLTHVRFRAHKRMMTRENLLADVARWLEDYEEVEALVADQEPWDLADVAKQLKRSRKQGVELGKHAAALAREALGLSEGEHEDAIRDMCGLLEDHGVKLLTAPVASEGFFGLSVGVDDGGVAAHTVPWTLCRVTSVTCVEACGALGAALAVAA